MTSKFVSLTVITVHLAVATASSDSFPLHPQCLCKPQALDMAMGRNALSLGCGLHLAGNFFPHVEALGRQLENLSNFTHFGFFS